MDTNDDITSPATEPTTEAIQELQEVTKSEQPSVTQETHQKVIDVASSIGKDIVTAGEKIVVNIENSTTVALLIKKILLHPLMSLLIIVLVVFGAKYRIQNAILQQQVLKSQVTELNQELASMKAEAAKLAAQIKAFEAQRKKDKAENAKFANSLHNKTSEELKQVLLTYINRLKQERK